MSTEYQIYTSSGDAYSFTNSQAAAEVALQYDREGILDRIEVCVHVDGVEVSTNYVAPVEIQTGDGVRDLAQRLLAARVWLERKVVPGRGTSA